MRMLLFFVLIMLGASANAQDITCSRPMYEQPEWSFKNCAKKLSNGDWQFKKELISKLNFEKNNLAPVCIDGNHGCYWVNRNGKMVQVMGIEGSADPFSQGLSRHKKNGKIGFIDETLKVLITPKYDAAYPFDASETAVVCVGCKEVRDLQDDHGKLVGGSWSLINKTGRTVKDCGTVKEATLYAPLSCKIEN